MRQMRAKWRDQMLLQAMALLGVGYMALFYYGPMFGVVLAFKNYKFTKGVWGSPWVGLANFRELLFDFDMPMVLTNTVRIALLKMLICFPAPILFALLLNEVRRTRFQRLIQTASYFPHFISWAIVALMMQYLFTSDNSLVNAVLMKLGLINRPTNVLSDPNAFYAVAVLSELWKETGWSAIVFIAAIAGIDPEIYEAATVDGASQLQKIFRITLPNLTGAVSVMFMLNFAGLLSGGGGAFDQSFFLSNPLNYEKSIILGTYTLKTGIQMGRFSYATAVGLINSVVSLVLLLGCNALSKRFLGQSLYQGGDF